MRMVDSKQVSFICRIRFKIAVLGDTAFTPQGGTVGIMNSKSSFTSCKLDNVYLTLSISYIPVVVRFSFMIALSRLHSLILRWILNFDLKFARQRQAVADRNQAEMNTRIIVQFHVEGPDCQGIFILFVPVNNRAEP